MNDAVKAKLEKLKSVFEDGGQGQVFRYLDSIPSEEVPQFIEDLEEIDVERINRIYKESMENDAKMAKGDLEIQPIPDVVDVENTPKAQLEEWEKVGMKNIKDGKVGLLLLAGGQGTRLGSKDPKGMFDIGLPSHKSLFQLQAQRLRKMQEMVGGKVDIPWYIMTSPATFESTRRYFTKMAYFGLKRDQIVFFNQGTLPCMSGEGKILLENRSKIARAPDGNGGIYRGLLLNGVFADMERRGLDYIHAYCVDNCLVKVLDPLFIGCCISRNSDFGAKTVSKSTPEEKVGLISLRNGRPGVVEYSELPSKLANQRDEDGKLVYSSGNIAIHFYTVQCLKDSAVKYGDKIGYHVAKKAIPCATPPDGHTETPVSKNGIKLEMFIFDILPLFEMQSVFEVDRKDEFSPLKNAPPATSDTAKTARRDMTALHAQWVKRAGGEVESNTVVEVSPLLSVDGGGLEEVCRGKRFSGIVHLVSDEEKVVGV